MKKLWMALALWGALAAQLHAQWKPVEGRISTQWSEQVNPDKVLPEYPRPIMERTEWKNLNGLWDYAIIEKGKHSPSVFDGKILVPFAVESSLKSTLYNPSLTQKSDSQSLSFILVSMGLY